MRISAWRHWEQYWPSYHYVLLALLFFGGLELIFYIHRFIPLLTGLLTMVVVAGVVLLKAEEGQRFTATSLVLPALTVTGAVSFSLFLPVTALVHLFMAAMGLLFYCLLTWGARQAYPTWNWALAVIIFFLNAASVLGWRYYLYVPILFILSLSAVVAWLILWQSWQRLPTAPGQAVLLASGGALVLVELTWVLQFLPLHYLIQASILTIFYYLFFNLTRLYWRGQVRRVDLWEYGMVGVIALTIVLLLARWR